MKRLIKTLIFCLMLAAVPAFSASAEDGLEEIVADFMQEHGLNEKNFAMGFYSPDAPEPFYYNADKLMVGGSVYKLPLNMVFADRLNDGTYSPDDIVGGYTIERAQFFSIVYSNNEVSHAMQKYLFDNRPDYHDDYRRIIAQYSGLDPDELGEKYFRDNCFTARYMINTLKYLFEHAEDYETVIDYMKQAHPGRFFKLYEGEYEIAHKYGYYEGALNDCAIVYTPTPFMLAVFTQNAPNGEEMLGQLCSLMTDYALSLETANAEAAASAPSPEPETSEPEAPIEAPEAADENEPEPVSESPIPEPENPEDNASLPASAQSDAPELRFRAAIIIACAAAAAVMLAIWLIIRIRRKNA